MPCTAGITTVPVRTFGAGGGSGAGIISLPDVEHILFVDKGSNTTETGTRQQPFHVIADALTAAAALTPTASNPVAIYVLPGVYEETLTMDTAYIQLVGTNRATCIVSNSGIPLTVTASVSVEGLTFKNTAITRTALISGSSITAEFYNCVFRGANSSNSYLRVDSSATVVMDRCSFLNDTLSRTVFYLASGEATLTACSFEGVCIASDDLLTLRECDIVAAGGTAVGAVYFGLNTDVVITGCKITNTTGPALYAYQAPSSVHVTNNSLDSLSTGYDFLATANVTGPIYGNVMMAKGYSEYIRPDEPIRYVGQSGDTDYHSDLPNALDSCAVDGTNIILLMDTVVPTLYHYPVVETTIDGKGYSVAGATINVGILNTLSGKVLAFKNCAIVSMRLFVRSGPIHIEDCTVANVRFDCENVVDGLVVKRSVLTGANNYGSPIIITGTCGILIDSSYIKGYAGNEAIRWQADNDNVEIKNSTIMHGSLGTNNPFGRGGTQTPDYKSHHTGYNSDPETGGIWTNLVSSVDRYETIDVNADY